MSIELWPLDASEWELCIDKQYDAAIFMFILFELMLPVSLFLPIYLFYYSYFDNCFSCKWRSLAPEYDDYLLKYYPMF